MSKRISSRFYAVGGTALLCLVIVVAFYLWPARQHLDVDELQERARAEGLRVFQTDYPHVSVALKLPEDRDEWELTGIRGEVEGIRLPQMVHKKPPKCVGRIETHRVEIPEKDRRLPLDEKLGHIAAGRVQDWKSRAKKDAGEKGGQPPPAPLPNAPATTETISVANGTVPSPILVDGTPQPGVTVSTWLIERQPDRTHKQFRVTETMTILDRESYVIVIWFTAEEEVPGDSAALLKMDGSMVTDPKTGAMTFKPLARLHPDLEKARETLQIFTKP